ncbi:DNA glycosylase [Xylaria arbuscula]|nr:DNA glycosylase [Xylaria arbuscula]
MIDDEMEVPACHYQFSTATSRTNDFPDDFMFGFDVEDEDDRVYLAEVAMYRIGLEDDIKAFVHLSLLRGMEEWRQAICCASAMKNRGLCPDSLDGQDVLTYLSKIYRVDEHTRNVSDVSSPLRKLTCPRVKRKSKRTCELPDTEGVIPAKKRRRINNGRHSPFWDETRIAVRRQDDHSIEKPEATGLAKEASPSWKGPLAEQSGYDMIRQASEDLELASIFLDGGPQMSEGTSVNDSLGLVDKVREEDDDDTRDEALSKLNIPTLRVSDTPTPDIESQTTSNGPEEDETHNPNRSVDKLENPTTSPQPQTPKRKAKSPYFESAKPATTTTAADPSPKKRRPPRGTVSCIPFPRLDAPRFGLIQEELAPDPFRLLIAVTFLVRTSGKAAIPVFRELMSRYPSPSALAAAPAADVVRMIEHLGLGHVRAAKIQRFARLWVDEPPRDGVRYAVRNYCCAEQHPLGHHHLQQHPQGIIDPEEEEEGGGVVMTSVSVSASASASEWEIGHMTQGPYALDSWRIFCRDVLRGEALDWNGGGREGEFQPEWMRVLPRDKELRACLRWMWMREGWQWDPATGEKIVLPEELRRAVQEGRVAYDFDTGDLRILD